MRNAESVVVTKNGENLIFTFRTGESVEAFQISKLDVMRSAEVILEGLGVFDVVASLTPKETADQIEERLLKSNQQRATQAAGPMERLMREKGGWRGAAPSVRRNGPGKSNPMSDLMDDVNKAQNE